MFLTLVLHSGFSAVKSPTTIEVHEQFVQSFTRFLFDSLSITCVDIFVLISGWFGILPTNKGLFKFLFQTLYFILGIYLVTVLWGISPMTLKGIGSCFLFIQDYDYWFVRTYLLLFIMSPILNTFVEKTDRTTFKKVLFGFFLFQTLYAWGFVAVNAFAGGYSIISFIGLYLLARYVKCHKPRWSQMSKSKDFFVIISSIFSMAVLSFVSAYLGHPMSGKFCGSYVCPFVIISSLFMVIIFSKFRLQSKFINKVASSCFAVYLFHTHISIFYDYFKPTIVSIYSHFNGILCISMIGIFLISVFFTAILLDQPRRWIWNLIAKKYEYNKSSIHA